MSSTVVKPVVGGGGGEKVVTVSTAPVITATTVPVETSPYKVVTVRKEDSKLIYLVIAILIALILIALIYFVIHRGCSSNAECADKCKGAQGPCSAVCQDGKCTSINTVCPVDKPKWCPVTNTCIDAKDVCASENRVNTRPAEVTILPTRMPGSECSNDSDCNDLCPSNDPTCSATCINQRCIVRTDTWNAPSQNAPSCATGIFVGSSNGNRGGDNDLRSCMIREINVGPRFASKSSYEKKIYLDTIEGAYYSSASSGVSFSDSFLDYIRTSSSLTPDAKRELVSLHASCVQRY